MAIDYYDTLGVLRTANDSEIRRAFRQKARELHPDVNPNPDATERFQELNAAYEVLGDPVRRSIYDRMSARGAPRPGSYRPPPAPPPPPRSVHTTDWPRPETWQTPPFRTAPPVRPVSIPIKALARLVLTSGFFWAGTLILIGAAFFSASVYALLGWLWAVLLFASPVLLILSVADALGRAVGAPRGEIWRVVGIIVMLVMSFAVIPLAPPALLLQYADAHQIEWLSTFSSGWLFVMVMGGEVVTGIVLMVAFFGLRKRLIAPWSRRASTRR